MDAVTDIPGRNSSISFNRILTVNVAADCVWLLV